MADAKKFRKFGGGFSNAVEKNTFEYDFANDGGVVGSIDLGEADEDMVLHEAYIKALTTITSGGVPTVDVGVGADVDAIKVDASVAELTAGVVTKGETTSQQVKINSGDKINMAIVTAALTAGKFQVVLMVSKF